MKRIKRDVLLIMISAVLLAVLTATVGAKTTKITVKVDGTEIVFPDQQPYIKNDRTLVPVRFVAEALGYPVEWDPDDNSAVLDNGRLILFIGTDRAVLDGEPVVLDTVTELSGDRTMVPLRFVSENLGCTVDWIASSRTVLINRRDKNGKETSLFDRFLQTGGYDYIASGIKEYLYPKSDTGNRTLWIERPLDRTTLENQSFDCAIVIKAFTKENLTAADRLLTAAYPTEHEKVLEIMMQTIKGEIWQTFYEEDSEWYPLFAAVPARSGTFGSYYCDNREVEMYCTGNGTQLTVNINAEGYENPEIPRTLSQEEKDFYTAEAKKHYCLGLWGLDD